MDRVKQLEYCRKCKKQKFDPEQGVICGLTNEKAAFDNECEHFETDTSKFAKKTVTAATEKKGRFAFGFTPRKEENLRVPDLTKKQMLVLALEAAGNLGWNIGFTSESGFACYTKMSLSSWSEEVKIRIDVGNIAISSETTGSQLIDWGKNRGNIEAFTAEFNSVCNRISDYDIETKYKEWSDNFATDDGRPVSSPWETKSRMGGFGSLFIPSKGYFITPLIVIANILVFVVMVISGVHVLIPTLESLIAWGANFKPLTTEGEWWRLLTSTFLHVGVVHLVMNMYAFIYIGLLLEPYLGKARFLTAYLIAGISGSLASIMWHDLTVSAGASGAIFGMYGVFIALLTTRLIDKSARKSLLISIGIFVVYNLANGMKEGIDNAAHIGGLVGGLLVGYSFWPGLANKVKISKAATIGIVAVTFSAIFILVLNTMSSDLGKYTRDMDAFMKLENKALALYRLPGTATNEELLAEIDNNGIKAWEESLRLIEKAESYDIPPALKSRNKLLKEYILLRLKSYRIIRQAIIEDSDAYEYEINNLNRELENKINEISKIE